MRDREEHSIYRGETAIPLPPAGMVATTLRVAASITETFLPTPLAELAAQAARASPSSGASAGFCHLAQASSENHSKDISFMVYSTREWERGHQETTG